MQGDKLVQMQQAQNAATAALAEAQNLEVSRALGSAVIAKKL